MGRAGTEARQGAGVGGAEGKLTQQQTALLDALTRHAETVTG
ncbi:hypothetical protein [Kitasatospora sp. NPDC048538]